MPELFTVAMAVDEDLQETDLFDALLGDTVAVSRAVPPTGTVIAFWLRDTPVTATVLPPVTVTAQVAYLPLPSVAETVIVADPAAMP